MERIPSPDFSERNLQRRDARAEQTYRLFLKDLCEEGRMSEELAERAAVAVLSTLGTRIFRDEMRHLESQLPLKLQNLLTKEGEPTQSIPETFDRDAFIAKVGEKLGMMPSEAEPVVRVVLSVTRSHVSEGEFDDVATQLPWDWRDLWQRPM